MSVCVECCVLSGRGLCDELMTRPEKSYRMLCVVVCDLETSRMRRPWSAFGRSGTGKKEIWCIILPVVLYGCETWSLILREERKLRVFENMVLRRIFGPRRDEKTGEWRRLHNEELNDLYCSPNIVRVTKSRRMR